MKKQKTILFLSFFVLNLTSVFTFDFEPKEEYTIEKITNSQDIDDYDKTFFITDDNGIKVEYGIILNELTNNRETKPEGDISGEFVGNSAVDSGAVMSKTGYGGAIINYGESVDSIIANFIGNRAENSGGAIATEGDVIDDIQGNFIGNSAGENGGALYNLGSSALGSIIGNFLGNSASGDGGAIYNVGSITIRGTEDMTTLFDGNKAGGSGDAIYTEDKGTTYIYADENGQIVFRDSLAGGGTYNVGSDVYQGKVVLDADMSEVTGDVNFDGGTIEVGSNMGKNSRGETNFFKGNFNVRRNTVTFNTANNTIDRYNTEKWKTEKPLDVHIDIDLKGEVADVFVIAEDNPNVIINIKEINILNPMVQNEKIEIQIFEIDSNSSTPSSQLASSTNSTNQSNNTNLTLDEEAKSVVISDGVTTYEGEIDDSSIGVDGTLGFFGFEPTGVEPLALETPTAISGYSLINNAILERIFNKKRGTRLSHSLTNLNESIWFDSYSSDQKVKTSSHTFGHFDNEGQITLLGADFSSDYLRRKYPLYFPDNVEEVYKIYGGYVDSMQKYDRVSINQDGIILGVGAELNQEDVFLKLALNASRSKVRNNESGKSDNFNINSFSTGLKLGTTYLVSNDYYFEPSLTLSYQKISPENYTNVDGVRINSRAMDVIHMSQELKISKRYLGSLYVFDKYIKHLVPYGAFSVNHNAYHNGGVTGNGKALPNMNVGGYGQLRLGTEFIYDENLEAYGEISGSVGRVEGVSSELGLSYTF